MRTKETIVIKTPEELPESRSYILPNWKPHANNYRATAWAYLNREDGGDSVELNGTIYRLEASEASESKIELILRAWKESESEFPDKSTEFLLEITTQRVRLCDVACEYDEVAAALTKHGDFKRIK